MRIMITTSSRVAANMTAQGFNIKVRDFQTGRFIPFAVLPAAMETTGIFSIDEINKMIVEREYKDTVAPSDTDHQAFLHADDKLNGYGMYFHFIDNKRKGKVIADNHFIYDKLISENNDDPFYNLDDWKFQCDKRNLCWRNICYEIYA